MSGEGDVDFKSSAVASILNACRTSLKLLGRSDRFKYGFAVLAQLASSFLDLLGILLLGFAALQVAAIGGSSIPSSSIAGELPVDGVGLVAILACAAILLFVLKSVLSALISWKTLSFLARRERIISVAVGERVLQRRRTSVQKWSPTQISYALTGAATQAVVVLLSQASVFLAEVLLALSISVGLLWIDARIALVTLAYFALVGILLQRVLAKRAASIGRRKSRNDSEGTRAILEALTHQRELLVTTRVPYAVERIGKVRGEGALIAAELTFLSGLPKYVFEVALVLGGTMLGALLFSLNAPVEAAALLGLFLAAASRLVPSVMRAQAAALLMGTASTAARPLYDLVEATAGSDSIGALPKPSGIRGVDHPRSTSTHSPLHVSVREVSFRYAPSLPLVLEGASFDLAPGSLSVLMGDSGSGKSTLIDLLLGVLEPTFGSIAIGGQGGNPYEPRSGAIGFVPQNVRLILGSVRDNVCLWLPSSHMSDDRIWEALHRVHLGDVVRRLPEGLDTMVGEGAAELSGGQVQRLGIARALLTRPGLLVLDEPTSSLDPKAETRVLSELSALSQQVTILMATHRPQVLGIVDQTLCITHGRIEVATPLSPEEGSDSS